MEPDPLVRECDADHFWEWTPRNRKAGSGERWLRGWIPHRIRKLQQITRSVYEAGVTSSLAICFRLETRFPSGAYWSFRTRSWLRRVAIAPQAMGSALKGDPPRSRGAGLPA